MRYDTWRGIELVNFDPELNDKKARKILDLLQLNAF